MFKNNLPMQRLWILKTGGKIELQSETSFQIDFQLK